MKATFQLIAPHEPVVALLPDTNEERILMAAFIRYDSNVFSVIVDRNEAGLITRIFFRAEARS